MKSINIILGNALMTCGNQGCIALTVTSLYLIDKLLSKSNISYKIYLPDCGNEGKNQFYIDGKNIIYYGCSYPPETSKELLKDCLRRRIVSKYKTFRNADYILDIGQGDSFADIYGIQRFKMIDKIHKMARIFNKPYCMLPQTIGPFENERIKEQAHKSIENATLCMVRDKQSLDYVVNNIPTQKCIKEYIDVAFFMPYKEKCFNDRFIHIGLNVSALLWHGGYTMDNQFGLKDDYKVIVRKIIDYFLEQENIKIHLIPHVVHAKRILENDYSVSLDLVNEYNSDKLIVSPFFFSPIEAKGYISAMDFFIGARMHATIAAFSSNTPVVPMAYSRKFNGLFEGTLQYPYMVDMKRQTTNEIMSLVKDAFNKRETLKAIISDRMSGIVQDKERMLLKDLEIFFNI